MPRALLLDLYGTLVEEDGPIVAAIAAEIARLAPGSPAAQDVLSLWGRRFRELCEASHGPGFLTQREVERRSLTEVLTHFGASMDVEELCARLFARWQAPPLFPEVPEVLAGVSLPICLVSNIDDGDLQQALAHLGLSFPHVVTSEAVRAYKPRPEPFLRALGRLGLGPSEVLHIGDGRSSDVPGAQALGIPVAWVNRDGRALPKGAPRPDFEWRDLRELSRAAAG
jgi:2-haloalkanoic acid dehalogenase type II